MSRLCPTCFWVGWMTKACCSNWTPRTLRNLFQQLQEQGAAFLLTV